MTSATDLPESSVEGAEPGAPRRTIQRSTRRTPLYAAVGVVVVIVLLVLVGFETNWFGTQHTSPASTVTPPGSIPACPSGVMFEGAGAQAATALMGAWTQTYNSASGNSADYNPSGSGAGLTSFTAKSVDFAVTDDPLNATQTAALPTPAETIPIIGTAVPIIYNLPGVTKSISLSGAVLAGIYLGQITNWNDTRITQNNSGITFPNKTIIPVHRSDAAGLTYVFTNLLADDSAAWSSGPGWSTAVSWPTAGTPVGIKGNSAVLTYVQLNLYTIGYSDLADVLGNPGIQYAKILNPAGHFVLPNLANTQAAIANLSATTSFPNASGNWDGVSMVNSAGSYDYPLATFIYAFVYQKSDQGFSPTLEKTQALRQFLNWTLSEGQLSAPSLYYAALPATVLANNRAALGSITYNGAAVPACT